MHQNLEVDVREAQKEQRVPSRRGRLEIRMDMLTAVKEGAEGPTQIMYKANLSWIVVRQHLKELVDCGMLVEHNVRNRLKFEITERGISVLRSYSLVVDQIRVADEDGAPLRPHMFA